MSAPVIELDGVSLCYRLAKQRIPSFKEYTIHLLKGTLSYEQFWALRDIDLMVRARRAAGHRGAQRRRQEQPAEGHLAGAPAHPRHGGGAGPAGADPGAGKRLRLRADRLGERLPERAAARPFAARDPAGDRRHRRFRRARGFHLLSDPQLLVRHAGAAGIRHRHGLGARRAGARRSPGGGRRRLPAEVRGAHAALPRRRDDHLARLPQPRRPSWTTASGRCGWITAASAPTARRPRCSTSTSARRPPRPRRRRSSA